MIVLKEDKSASCHSLIIKLDVLYASLGDIGHSKSNTLDFPMMFLSFFMNTYIVIVEYRVYSLQSPSGKI